ncbi:chemotaxis protein [Hahella sp. CCB-MM4]|uniref:methyl-accepting chemotaxis protein n=1 Tax=Hahella sp. (strain CCB-MM4) TaxID=1926491 RepID=UPI000B9B33B1|nr:PAS domain S-box protein [Hahella sp. CCB-MM4]OZG70164.1 chemotaxis protein [Hahella sp. CCB-MM4]
MKSSMWGRLRLDLFSRPAELEMLRNVVEYAPNAIVLIEKSGEIVLINAQTETQFGYSREELIGQRVEMLVPQRFRSEHPNHRHGFFSNPSRRSMGAGRDLYGLRKDGIEFPIEIGLNPIRANGEYLALASIIDITERTRAEKRFRQVLEAVPNSIVQVNRGGTIMMVNSQAEKLFGYTRDELIGQPLDLLIPERFRSHHGSYLASYFNNPQTRMMGSGRELYGRRRDGSEVPVEIGLSTIESVDGLLVLASILDISLRKRAEEKEKIVLQELLQGISVLASTSEQIMDSVNQAASTTQETATSISEIATTVQEVKQTAIMAGQKAKAVTDSVERTQSVAKDGSEAVDETLHGMSQIREQMSAIGESIMRLSEQTQTVGDVVSMVSDMAEQSNLLGVNASIEAAKAGEFGKGFAVVAQEVKALAAQSKKATAQVRSILSDVQKAMTKAVMVAEQGSKAVEAGYQRAQVSGKAITTLNQSLTESSELAIQIAATSKQQNVGMDQISDAMANIRQASQDNVSSIQQVEKAVRSLHELGSQLKNMTDSFDQLEIQPNVPGNETS